MIIGEFDLIQKISGSISVPSGILGIGDDCAVIPQHNGFNTLISTDMLVEGTHFLFDAITPFKLGWKSFAVNLSDIAAMGGSPCGSFLSLGLSENINSEWMEDFIKGYNELSNIYNCPLLGGDTTNSKDKLCINVTILGTCKTNKEILRSGAKAGDLICVTGCLGDSAAGLKKILSGITQGKLIDKHYRPYPRIKEGQVLSETIGVHSMMDISDGIGSDLRHILKASNKSAIIDTSKIPLSSELINSGFDTLDLALNGGEDYELLFTMSPNCKPNIEYYIIGEIIDKSEKDIIWQGSQKEYYGYRHF